MEAGGFAVQSQFGVKGWRRLRNEANLGGEGGFALRSHLRQLGAGAWKELRKTNPICLGTTVLRFEAKFQKQTHLMSERLNFLFVQQKSARTVGRSGAFLENVGRIHNSLDILYGGMRWLSIA